MSGCGCADSPGVSGQEGSCCGPARNRPSRPGRIRGSGASAPAGAARARESRRAARLFGRSTAAQASYRALVARFGPPLERRSPPRFLREELAQGWLVRREPDALLASALSDEEVDSLLTPVLRLRTSLGTASGPGGCASLQAAITVADTPRIALVQQRLVEAAGPAITIEQVAGERSPRLQDPELVDAIAPILERDSGYQGPSPETTIHGQADFPFQLDPARTMSDDVLPAPGEGLVPPGLGSGGDGELPCFSFRAFVRNDQPIDIYCVPDWESSWDESSFAACAEATYAEAVVKLTGDYGEDWESALWGMVDGGEVVSSAALDDNLAPSDVTPQWYTWDATRTKYEPDVDSAPRRALMRRAMWMICKYQEGIPKTWDSLEVRASVIEPLEAGAMSFRIIDRVLFGDWEAYGTEIAGAWAGLEGAYAEIVMWSGEAEQAAEEVEGSEKRVEKWEDHTQVGEVDALLQELFEFLENLAGCAADPDTCSELLGATTSLDDLVADLTAFLLLISGFEEPLLEPLADALNGLLGALNAIRGLVKQLERWFMALDVEELIEEVVRTSTCVGPANHYLKSAPSSSSAFRCRAACDTATGTALYGAMRFEWGWEDAFGNAPAAAEPVNVGHNHGWLNPRIHLPARTTVNHDFTETDHTAAWGNRVWFCTTHLDRDAIMYDWYVSVATRIFATLSALDPTSDRYAAAQLAVNHCLRMAMGVAAEFAGMIVHETAHNLSLWHCSEPTTIAEGKKISCAQDVARVAWRLHVTAVCGLPWVAHDFPDDTDQEAFSEVVWDIRLGNAADADWGEVWEAGDYMFSWVSPDGSEQIQPYVFERVICVGPSSEGEAATAETLDDIGSWLVDMANILGFAEALGVGTEDDWMDPLWQVGTIFQSIADEETFWTAYDDQFANLTFSIDTPLQPGGAVTWACLWHQNSCCLPDGSGGYRELWGKDAPPGYLGCCVPVDYSDDAIVEGSCG